ncbi:RNA polymerase sigma factor [Xylocopilactobacillus apis]|uniref:RNA polymerase sigma factor n=1 Tax=Xylocopilactobacillus apis TaxID=2932183 RepID=A0AAU9D3L3_9LACO|nr:sigma-70 family RNA polymerase sigma factor [Xylocopilactobacillus apis]BDR57131.1 RNA polymerase sigma factor [Xylocopilactobacillus apis]
MDDQQIASAVKNKDEAVFDDVVNQYSKLLWVIAFSIIGKQTSESDVEELVSDVFWRFWQYPEKYDPSRGSLKNYLSLLTRSMAINKLQVKHDPIESDQDFILENLPDHTETNQTFWHLLFTAIESLSEPTKRICFERFFLELKPAAISENLELNVTEINNRLYQGKKKLKPILQKLMEEEL